MSLTNPQKTCDLLSKFMVSQGIPYQAIRSASFRELLKHFDPKAEPPTERELEQSLKGAEPSRIDCEQGGGAISVTVDMSDFCDEKFLVFSIHNFSTNSYERTAVVHFKKLEVAQFNWPTLWFLIHSSFSTYTNFSTINVVFSSPELADVFKPSESPSTTIRHDFICFYDYVSEFAIKVLDIDEIQKSLRIFEKILRIVKTNAQVYQCFVDFQKSKNLDTILPSCRKGCWQDELFFLTRCLEMDSTFRELDTDWDFSDDYISAASFNQLLHVQKVLDECQRGLQDLTTSESSISQVIPTMARIQKFLSMYSSFGEVNILNLNYKIQRLFEETIDSVGRSQRHRFATWLDPRYAWNRNVFTEAQQEAIGKEILEHLNDLGAEIESYMKILYEKPPDASERPFLWWHFHQERLPILAKMARGFLTCPAVAIDAQYYFGGGAGKLSHISKVYSRNSDLDWLKFTGHQQEFQGRGAGATYRRSDGFAKPDLRFKAEQSTTEQSEKPRGKKRKLETPVLQNPPKRVRDYPYVRKSIKWTPPTTMGFIKPVATLKEALQATTPAAEDVPPSMTLNEMLLKEVKMEVVEGSEGNGGFEDPEEVDPEALLSTLAPLMNGKNSLVKKRSQCKRSCILCHRMRLHEEVKNVTIPGEKLLMTMGLLKMGLVTEAHAQAIYVRQKKSFFCREHYGEAAAEVLAMLGVGGINELRKCSMAPLQGFCDKITQGKVLLKSDQSLRGFIVNFIEKYLEWKPSETLENHSHSDHDDADVNNSMPV